MADGNDTTKPEVCRSGSGAGALTLAEFPNASHYFFARWNARHAA
jgi:hypothetical protein